MQLGLLFFMRIPIYDIIESTDLSKNSVACVREQEYGPQSNVPLKKIVSKKLKDRALTDTVHKILSTRGRPGSILHTDMCRAYTKQCATLNLTHFTAGPPKTLKDSVTGRNTGIKCKIKPINRTRADILSNFRYFMCRR
ncbi:hypothetical protein HZS_7759 [Henneguya salminicola]|nr:hypothetical protein HZS_7759 [Henneguya salminicola]